MHNDLEIAAAPPNQIFSYGDLFLTDGDVRMLIHWRGPDVALLSLSHDDKDIFTLPTTKVKLDSESLRRQMGEAYHSWEYLGKCHLRITPMSYLESKD